MAKITLPENGDVNHLWKMYDLGKQLLVEHNLPDWTLKFDRSVKRAGLTDYTKRTISISAPLFSIWTEDQCRDTILHEIAHALTPDDHGHGREWRTVCRAIGAKPKRCYSASEHESIPARWTGTCPAGHKTHRERLSARALRSSCGSCSPRYNPDYKFTWEKN